MNTFNVIKPLALNFGEVLDLCLCQDLVADSNTYAVSITSGKLQGPCDAEADVGKPDYYSDSAQDSVLPKRVLGRPNYGEAVHSTFWYTSMQYGTRPE
ncbi:hypothetical protein A0H81_07727 [Grifola frondosa]|uniref:Uncharacterized protein n=1 Tax=Grifola frondosa TaxID=5627 RepID=A0A1C7M717_GRIFR|nr:hypothetical protein A0H81_07727 [Grifola frondosa]